MRYGSVCSGIEAATVAWKPLGWQASFFSEIDAFPRELLAHHYPDVPLHGDFTTIQKDDYEPIDLLIGGTPCQSFSIAGLREGLDDPRGNLMLGFGSLAERLRPKWLVWENVPGVLSSNGGRDFGTFLAMLGELGYGFAYRVCDAQYYGIPQRRRRVFVIGCLGDWRSAAAVLFEQESMPWNPPPSRGEGEEVAPTLTRGFGDRGVDLDQIAGGGYALGKTCSGKDVFGTLMANCGDKQWLGNQEAFSGDYHVFSIAGNIIDRQPQNGGDGDGIQADVSYTLTTADRHAVVFNQQASITQGLSVSASVVPTLDTSKVPGVLSSMRVRRLTPLECERLQGFPDGYTQVPFGRSVSKAKLDDDYIKYQIRSTERVLSRDDAAKMAADSHRYKALGNSMAVPVIRWLGERIELVEKLQQELKVA